MLMFVLVINIVPQTMCIHSGVSALIRSCEIVCEVTMYEVKAGFSALVLFKQHPKASADRHCILSRGKLYILKHLKDALIDVIILMNVTFLKLHKCHITLYRSVIFSCQVIISISIIKGLVHKN